MTEILARPSVRPDETQAISARTGLSEAQLERLVHSFYAKVRDDDLLGPIFAARISDWEPHLEKMVAFWSSVTLKTGRYHGRPVPAHLPLPIEGEHFERWLMLFRQTAKEICRPEGAALVIEAAERIARSLRMATELARSMPGAEPVLR